MKREYNVNHYADGRLHSADLEKKGTAPNPLPDGRCAVLLLVQRPRALVRVRRAGPRPNALGPREHPDALRLARWMPWVATAAALGVLFLLAISWGAG